MIIILTYSLLYIWSKMLSSSRDVLLKLSVTTSHQKLFQSDCITLYCTYYTKISIIDWTISWLDGISILTPFFHLQIFLQLQYRLRRRIPMYCDRSLFKTLSMVTLLTFYISFTRESFFVNVTQKLYCLFLFCIFLRT